MNSKQQNSEVFESSISFSHNGIIYLRSRASKSWKLEAFLQWLFVNTHGKVEHSYFITSGGWLRMRKPVGVYATHRLRLFD